MKFEELVKSKFGKAVEGVALAAMLTTSVAGCSAPETEQHLDISHEERWKVEDDFFAWEGIGTFYPNERELFDIAHDDGTTTITTPEGHHIVFSFKEWQDAKTSSDYMEDNEALYVTEETGEVYKYKNIDWDGEFEPYNSRDLKEIFYLFWGNPPSGLSDVISDLDGVYFKLDGVQYAMDESIVKQAYAEYANEEFLHQAVNYAKQSLGYKSKDIDDEVLISVAPVNYWEMSRDENGAYGGGGNGLSTERIDIIRNDMPEGTSERVESYNFQEWSEKYAELVKTGAVTDPDYIESLPAPNSTAPSDAEEPGELNVPQSETDTTEQPGQSEQGEDFDPSRIVTNMYIFNMPKGYIEAYSSPARNTKTGESTTIYEYFYQHSEGSYEKNTSNYLRVYIPGMYNIDGDKFFKSGAELDSLGENKVDTVKKGGVTFKIVDREHQNRSSKKEVYIFPSKLNGEKAPVCFTCDFVVSADVFATRDVDEEAVTQEYNDKILNQILAGIEVR